MGHSTGDGIIVAALAAAFIGYLYLKHRDRRSRLEVLHAERMAAMDKGIPLPELPIDPSSAHPQAPPDARVPLFLGIFIGSFGVGSMVAFMLVPRIHEFWPLPLPLALMGLGLVLYYFLAGRAS